MSIANSLKTIRQQLNGTVVKLVAVSKTKPNDMIMEAYQEGQRVFGENKVQELVEKQPVLPQDIEWHMIGHLQRNKVKFIAPFIALIHGVDTVKLLKEINKEGRKNNRIISCLIQVHIADEATKFGFSPDQVDELFGADLLDELENISIKGLMGMATNTNDQHKVSQEFASLKSLFDQLKSTYSHPQLALEELSMGMSGDYQLAIAEGSTMVRIGSTIFGARNYAQ